MKRFVSACALLALAGCATIPVGLAPAALETDPMTGGGDRADDPAVWIHPTDPAKSLILGSNKDEGLYVYGIDGKERQRLVVGLSNNVDLRGNLAVVSNDGVNALSFFRIDPATSQVSHAGDAKVVKTEPYGVCAGVVGGAYQAAATYKDGTIEFYAVTDTGSGPVTMSLARTTKLPTQLEGCVFDEENGRFFVGEEGAGVWVLELADLEKRSMIDKVGSPSGLVADVEGMSLWKAPDGSGYLVVSAQTKDRYIVYDRKPPHAALGPVSVAASRDGSVDAVSHTDGLDVVSAALPGFPQGVLVVQDDANPKKEQSQNFKVVDWRDVVAALESLKAPAKP